MNKICYFDPSGHQGHFQEGHPERPERVESLKRALQESGHWELGPKLKAAKVDQQVLEGVHSDNYLRQLKQLSARGQGFDQETYLTRKSWDLAMQAAGGAIAVAEHVWERKADKGFALTRPPGHHATISQAMGFCLINNIAVAAEYLLSIKGAERIAIIDIDVHHGNGTQDIFYERKDVFFASIHQSPLYPGSGQLEETGTNAGNGYTQNIALPAYSGDEAYLSILEHIVLPTLAKYKPEMLLISFGYDAHWKDPLAAMQLSAQGYFDILERIRNFSDDNCQGRLAVILEGGYDLEAAAACGLAVTQALLEEKFVDELGAGPFPDSEAWKSAETRALKLWDLK